MKLPPKSVYDTNALVSALLAAARGRRTGTLVRCWDAVLEKRVRLCTSPHLLDELVRVLQYPRIGEPPGRALRYADLVARLAIVVDPPGMLSVLRTDPDDNHALECATAAGADYLVTGNLKHFEELGRDAAGALAYDTTRIVSPREFLDAIGLDG